MDEWDALEDASKEAPVKDEGGEAASGDAKEEMLPGMEERHLAEVEARLTALAERLHYAEAEIAEIKKTRKQAIADIEALIPEGRTDPVRAGDWMIEVSRGERWSWDRNTLDKILEAKGLTMKEELPAFISKTTGIKRSEFEAQPEDVRMEYMPALTRNKGVTTVKVTPDTPSLYKARA